MTRPPTPAPTAPISASTAREIATAIEARIRQGQLGAGARLPTIRSLAAELGVSPMTVATAYRELRRRGLVAAAGRRGTRVSERPPLALAATPSVPSGVRDLVTGNPDRELLPSLAAALATVDPTPRLYRPEATSPALAELAREQFAADGIDAPALAVVAGALDAVERVLAAHLRPGDPVAVEDPGYVRVFDLLRGVGLELVPVRVDDLGPLPDELERALAGGVGAVILTPRAQNPRGSALDDARAGELRDLLARYADVLVIEDDHAGVVAGAPALSVCAPDRPHWAISRSVSKTLGPDLRLAVVAGDAETIARVEGRQMLGTGWVSHIVQQLTVALLSDSNAVALIEQAAESYAVRRLALINALAEHGITGHGRSGLHVWVPVAQEAAVVTALLERGWAVMAGERWRLRTSPAIRITTAALRPDEADQLAADLAEVLAHRIGTYSA
jgi:DNA-binding transcriptional MocR family regulator